MQNHARNDNFNIEKTATPLFSRAIRDAIGATSPFALKNSKEFTITEKQIEILEDAIKRYERLEDVKKFSKIALEEMDVVTEDDIKRALELEKMVSIEDEKAVLNLIQNEGFLEDLESRDFSEILNAACEAELDDKNSEDDFSDFDFDPE